MDDRDQLASIGLEAFDELASTWGADRRRDRGLRLERGMVTDPDHPRLRRLVGTLRIESLDPARDLETGIESHVGDVSGEPAGSDETHPAD